jgi:histidinol dehydrogenase
MTSPPALAPVHRRCGFDAALKARLHWSADTDAASSSRGRHPGRRAAARRRRGAGVHRRFDGMQAAVAWASWNSRRQELKAAFDSLRRQRDALEAAARRVRSYHEAQKKASGESWSYRDADGTLLGQKVTPLDRVGIYVPGGKAAYPSSVLMNAIPAHVAGVGEIIMVVPTPRGEKNPLVLAAATWPASPAPSPSAARRPWRAGLRHADRAARRQDHRPRQCLRRQRQKARLRPGRHRHDRRPERDPGAGRRQHAGRLGGDGPVLARPSTTSWRKASCCAPTPPTSTQVQAAIDRLLPEMPRAEIIAKSLNGRGALIHTRSMEEACEISNRIAPEHLEDRQQRAAPLGAAAAARRRDLPGRLHQRIAGRLLRRPEPRAAHQRHGALLQPAGRLRLPEAQQPDRSQRSRRPEARAIAAELAYGEGLQAHARAAEMRLKTVPEMSPPK